MELTEQLVVVSDKNSSHYAKSYATTQIYNSIDQKMLKRVELLRVSIRSEQSYNQSRKSQTSHSVKSTESANQKDSERKDEKENIRHKMAFFDWYSVQHGFLKAFRVFFLKSFFETAWTQFFKSIGSSIGVFIVRCFVLQVLGLDKFMRALD